MRALLRNLTLLENGDLVRVHDRGEAVRDEDDRRVALSDERVERRLHLCRNKMSRRISIDAAPARRRHSLYCLICAQACTACCESSSSADVASSSRMILGFLKKMRAMATRWRWPPDRRPPRSPTRV